MTDRPDIDPASSRRSLMLGATGVAAAASMLAAPRAAAATQPRPGNDHLPGLGSHVVTAKDGCRIYVKDWGQGRPIVFSHGWPLTADAWDSQMMYLGTRGYRVIAHDRRGHGRSDQPWGTNDMDHYADDLGMVLDTLGVRDATLVGHSTGGGEVAHYIGRHGTSRVAKVVLIGAVPPIMLKTESNPGGLPIEVFDKIRAGVLADRSQFYKDLAVPFFGFNRPNAKTSQGAIDSFWRQGMVGSIKGQYDCIKQFSEVDYTPDLKKIDKPTLVLHGGDDQIVPIADSGELSAKIVKGAKLQVIQGAPHGMCYTNADQVNEALLAFIKG